MQFTDEQICVIIDALKDRIMFDESFLKDDIPAEDIVDTKNNIDACNQIINILEAQS